MLKQIFHCTQNAKYMHCRTEGFMRHRTIGTGDFIHTCKVARVELTKNVGHTPSWHGPDYPIVVVIVGDCPPVVDLFLSTGQMTDTHDNISKGEKSYSKPMDFQSL